MVVKCFIDYVFNKFGLGKGEIVDGEEFGFKWGVFVVVKMEEIICRLVKRDGLKR